MRVTPQEWMEIQRRLGPKAIMEKDEAWIAKAPPTPDSTSLVTVKITDEDKLNKLEKKVLRELRILFPVVHIQSMTLKLADDTRYTPDFWVVDANGQIICHEAKGFWRDDAKVKIKVAARLFRELRFCSVTEDKTTKKLKYEPIKP